jgi:hypothetical protein
VNRSYLVGPMSRVGDVSSGPQRITFRSLRAACHLRGMADGTPAGRRAETLYPVQGSSSAHRRASASMSGLDDSQAAATARAESPAAPQSAYSRCIVENDGISKGLVIGSIFLHLS